MSFISWEWKVRNSLICWIWSWSSILAKTSIHYKMKTTMILIVRDRKMHPVPSSSPFKRAKSSSKNRPKPQKKKVSPSYLLSTNHCHNYKPNPTSSRFLMKSLMHRTFWKDYRNCLFHSSPQSPLRRSSHSHRFWKSILSIRALSCSRFPKKLLKWFLNRSRKCHRQIQNKNCKNTRKYILWSFRA